MTIEITYCPVEIELKEEGTIKNYLFKTDESKPHKITVDKNLSQYGADDLSVWLEVAKHLNNDEFLSKYGSLTHEESNKSHWRWISYLKINVISVEEV